MFRQGLRAIKSQIQFPKTTVHLQPIQITRAIRVKPTLAVRSLHTTPKLDASSKKVISKLQVESKRQEPLQSSLLIPALFVGTGALIGAVVALNEVSKMFDGIFYPKRETWSQWWERTAKEAKEREEFLSDTSPIVKKLYDASKYDVREKYISDTPAESLRKSIVTLRDLTQVLYLLPYDPQNLLLEKLGSSYLQNLIKTDSDLNNLTINAKLSSYNSPNTYYYLLSLIRPDQLVSLLQYTNEFDRVFGSGGGVSERARPRILQALKDENLHKLIDTTQKLDLVLDHLPSSGDKNLIEKHKLLSRFDKTFTDQWIAFCEQKEKASSANKYRM